MSYSSKNVITEDGRITGEKVDSKDIKRVISSKVKEQNDFHTWWDEEVELEDGRVVKIRNITRNGEYYG